MPLSPSSFSDQYGAAHAMAAFSGALKQAERPRVAVLSAVWAASRIIGWGLVQLSSQQGGAQYDAQSASVEFARRNKRTQLIAFHPERWTALSEPFQRGVAEGKLFPPSFVAQRLVGLLDEVPTTGTCTWTGMAIPY